MALFPEFGSTFETALFNCQGPARFGLPCSSNMSAAPTPKRFLPNIEFIITPPATPTRSAAASPSAPPALDELLALVPSQPTLKMEDDSLGLHMGLPMTPPPMDYSVEPHASSTILDSVARMLSEDNLLDLEADAEFEATMASLRFADLDAHVHDLSWTSSRPSSQSTWLEPPSHPASPASELEDSELKLSEPSPMLVTTRSGRQIRHVRYESATTAGVPEPPSPVARRRKRPAGVDASKQPVRRRMSAPSDKRDTHNISERMRRRDLKVCFDALRDEVPTVRDDHRVHTSTVLQMAIEYVRQLQSEDRRIELELQEQRKLHALLLHGHVC